MLEDRKMDGGGKGENKVSHELAVAVIYGAGIEEVGARVQQEQTRELVMGLHKHRSGKALQS